LAEKSEVWRPIFGLEAYAASSLGRVMRVRGGRGARLGGILKPKPHKHGYRVVDLSQDNIVTRLTIARCMALAFYGAPPTPDHVAAHWDGNPKHDRLDNIRWATYDENMADADRHGTLERGSAHHNSKLTEGDVRAMRQLKRDGLTYAQIAERFPINKSNCCAAILGRTWSHVQ
jgi:hypothetical protein